MSLSIQQRRELLKSKRKCFNCLRSGCSANTCPTKASCRHCNQRHHSLIHTNTENRSPHPVLTCVSESNNLLPTAQVMVTSKGKKKIVKALVDAGSTATLISQSLVDSMKLPINQISNQIITIGNTKTSPITMETEFMLDSLQHEYQKRTTAMVVPSIIKYKPASPISNWPHIKNLDLADPTFNLPSHIDILLGCDTFAEIILPEIVRGPVNSPIAINTKLGFLLMGTNKGSSKETQVPRNQSIPSTKPGPSSSPSNEHVQNSDHRKEDSTVSQTSSSKSFNRTMQDEVPVAMTTLEAASFIPSQLPCMQRPKRSSQEVFPKSSINQQPQNPECFIQSLQMEATQESRPIPEATNNISEGGLWINGPLVTNDIPFEQTSPSTTKSSCPEVRESSQAVDNQIIKVENDDRLLQRYNHFPQSMVSYPEVQSRPAEPIDYGENVKPHPVICSLMIQKFM